MAAVAMAAAAMLVVQGVMHVFFMNLPMFTYHLVTASLSGIIVIAAVPNSA